VFPRFAIVLALTFCASAFGQSSHVVISQVYGGGGNSGASYRNDFVELFNRSSNAVTLNGWSVQYAAAAGTSWQVTPLTNTIAPGGYYLIQQSSGGSTGTNLPSPDMVASIAMSATAGKVALVNNSSALSGSCPLPHSAIIDFVGYGTTASCFEGNRAPTPSSVSSLRRAFEGCLDTDDNESDFFAGAVIPRNSSSPVHACDVVLRAYAIHEIQGTNPFSPLADQSVSTTTNLVTGRRSNGFFLQTPEGEEDKTALTSEGIFVQTAGTPGTNALIGHAVVVTGTVVEFRPPSDPASPPRTQINANHIRFISAENALPAPITLTFADLQPNGGHEQLERFEGMRVAVDALRVTSPTDGFLNESNATATSSGVFYGVLGERAFREPGIDVFETLPPGAPCCVPRFDGNPEILRIDSNGQLGAARLDTSPLLIMGGFIGPLYYEARRYTLLPDADSDPRVLLILAHREPPPPRTGEVTIASLNLQHFYDTVDDAGIADAELTPIAYSNRLRKAGLLFRDEMHRPDILGLAEVENLGVLQDLAAASAAPYAVFLLPGNDLGGINVGFLVNTSRVEAIEVTQHGKNATFTHPLTGMPATLHDRPPLLLRALIPDPLTTNTLALTVIMNHLRSLLDIENPANGAFVRAKRRAQAEYVAELVQQRQSLGEHVVVMGDFNAFEFNDGYVDVMGTIAGTPSPSNNVVAASPDLVEPNLINLIETLPAQERYSYVFEGTAQALDHILVSQGLRPHVRLFLYPRYNADAPEVSRNDPQFPWRISDHDAAMVYLYVTGRTPARITSIDRTAAEVVLKGEGHAGQGYFIEKSYGLHQWFVIGSAPADQAGRFTFRDLNPVSGAVFYRLRSD
jgi:uncharacterized protein